MGKSSGDCHGDGPTQGQRKVVIKSDNAEAEVGLEEAQFAVVATEPFTAFDYGVYGLATFGFAVVIFGAYKHYTKEGEEYSRV